MRAPSISPHRFRRQLIVTLALFGLVSAAVLMPGVVGAALKSSHPAIPAAGEVFNYYAAQGSNDLTDHGGSVIQNPKVFLIFEGTWAASDMQTVNQYFTDVSGSPLEGILSQYDGISNTITVSGSVMDPNFIHSDLCGSNTISDSGLFPAPTEPGGGLDPYANIWYEIFREVPSTDGSTIYFVFTPPNYAVFGPTDTCNNTSDCGYHNNFPGGAIYAVIPWGGTCNNGSQPSDFPPGTPGLQIDINTASHEQFEAITNPTWTIFQQQGNGWYSSDSCNGMSFCEIGDKCEGEHYGVSLNGHLYPYVQGEYDNSSTAKDPITGQALKCAYTVQPPPTPTPTNTPVPTCSVTNETDNIQPSNGTNPYVDNRGNTWYVYYDIKRDAKTNAPCQMQLVVRIFNPAPNGAWSGTASLYTLVNGNYDSASFGKVSGSCTYQYHFVWRGPWFKAGSAYYHLETFEYNGSNAYTRAWANFSI